MLSSILGACRAMGNAELRAECERRGELFMQATTELVAYEEAMHFIKTIVTSEQSRAIQRWCRENKDADYTERSKATLRAALAKIS